TQSSQKPTASTKKPKDGDSAELPVEALKERKAAAPTTKTADTKKNKPTDKKLSLPIDSTGKKEKAKEGDEKPAASTFAISPSTETKKTKATDKEQSGPINATDKKEKTKEGAAKSKAEESALSPVEKPKERKPVPTETADTKKAELTGQKPSFPNDATD